MASLKTKAVRDGDHYVVNGQKTWTTYGQYANRIFCLVRTKFDGKPQAGISFLLVDLDTPGIEMRPIRLIEGGYEVIEVFFTDVRVPVANLVGEENTGWTIAKYLLGHERTNIAGTGFSVQALEQVKALARKVKRGGRPLIESPLFAARLASVEAELEAVKITNLRMLSKAASGGQLGAEPSMLKIKGTVIRQELNDLARRALGPAAAPFPSEDLDNLAIAPREAAHNAAGYFNKSHPLTELLEAIRKIHRGGRFISQALAEQIALSVSPEAAQKPHELLSNRELQVLRLIASGLTPTEIAGELHLSVKTVSTYRARVLDKMGLRNTLELMSYALREGLVDSPVTPGS